MSPCTETPMWFTLWLDSCFPFCFCLWQSVLKCPTFSQPMHLGDYFGLGFWAPTSAAPPGDLRLCAPAWDSPRLDVISSFRRDSWMKGRVLLSFVLKLDTTLSQLPGRRKLGFFLTSSPITDSRYVLHFTKIYFRDPSSAISMLNSFLISSMKFSLVLRLKWPVNAFQESASVSHDVTR